MSLTGHNYSTGTVSSINRPAISAAQNIAQGGPNPNDPYGIGMNIPLRPEWQAANAGSMLPSELQSRGGYSPNQIGFGQYGKALGDKASSNVWLNLATQRQRLEENQALEQQAKAAAGQSAQAISNLGMRGGIRGGARERLAAQGAENALLGQQNVRTAGMGQRAGLSVADEEQKQRLLAGLSGQEQQYGMFNEGNRQKQAALNQQAQQFNTQNALRQIELQNAADLAAWQSLGQIASAKYTANAAQQEPKKGFLGTLLGDIL